MLEIYCQKNTAVIIKMVGKIYYKEPQGPFKVYIKKKNTYCCLKCRKRTYNTSIMPQQVVNKLITQKSTCADCSSKKSGFSKEDKLKN